MDSINKESFPEVMTVKGSNLAAPGDLRKIYRNSNESIAVTTDPSGKIVTVEAKVKRQGQPGVDFAAYQMING